MLARNDNRAATTAAALVVAAVFLAGFHCLLRHYGRPLLVAIWLRLLELLPPYW